MATLTVSPNPVLPSGIVNLHGAGFNTSSIVVSCSGTTYKSTFRTRIDGTFDIGVAMPASVGSYTIKATVGSTVQAQITVAVAKPTPPPITVTFSSSISNGSIISGTTQWVATVLTGTPKYFEFSIDGKLIWTELFSPWGGGLDTTVYKNGTHNLAITAYDNMSKPVAAQSVNVTFNNPVPPAPKNLTATASDKKVALGWQQ